MSNETIPAIPVLATQINDSDLFEKADGLAGGQSQRVPASLFKSYLAPAYFVSSPITLTTLIEQYVYHGLGAIPNLWDTYLVSIGIDNNFQKGYCFKISDIIASAQAQNQIAAESFATNVIIGTNISTRASSGLIGLCEGCLMTDGAGNGQPLNPAMWNLVCVGILF
jgi:hypothetical protein